jgi:hypothetical protein
MTECGGLSLACVPATFISLTDINDISNSAGPPKLETRNSNDESNPKYENRIRTRRIVSPFGHLVIRI